MDELMVQAYDQYLLQRSGCPPAAFSDVLLVNVTREPLGAGMRRDLGDSSSRQDLIRTASGRGYQFVGPVHLSRRTRYDGES